MAITGDAKQQDDNDGVSGRPPECADAGDHLGGCAHATEIGAYVDDVGDDEHGTRGPEHPAGIAAADDGGETAAGYHAEARAHELHGHHEGEREERGPERAIAEGGAGYGVGGDARRVVIGGAGNEAGAEFRKKSANEAFGGVRLAQCLKDSRRRASYILNIAVEALSNGARQGGIRLCPPQP